MSRKLVRLTEGDLHRIIKESVETILKEAQLNELDPRTYASYAQKRAAQGQHNKAKDGENAAIDAWNKEYNRPWNDDKMNSGYNVHNHMNYTHSTFDPKRNTYTEVGYKDKYNGETRAPYAKNAERFSKTQNLGDYYNPGNIGWKVAQQMAKGNGKYIKGEGWE